MQPSPARSNVLYPGAVTTRSGQYRVTHSTGHHPAATTYLNRGIHLPSCMVAGCVVSFEPVPAAHDADQKVRYKAAS